MQGYEIAERRTQSIHDRERGVWIVDAGRKCPHRDFDELANGKAQIGSDAACCAQRRRIPDSRFGTVDGRVNQSDGRPRKNIVAGADQQPNGGSMLGRPGGQALFVQMLQIAAPRVLQGQGADPVLARRRFRLRRSGPSRRGAYP